MIRSRPSEPEHDVSDLILSATRGLHGKHYFQSMFETLLKTGEVQFCSIYEIYDPGQPPLQILNYPDTAYQHDIQQALLRSLDDNASVLSGYYELSPLEGQVQIRNIVFPLSTGADMPTAILLLTCSQPFAEQLKKFVESEFGDRLAVEVEAYRLRRTAEKTSNDLRYFVETSRDMIWELDLDGRIINVNRSSIMIYGYYPDEMKGMHFSRLMSHKAAEEYQTYLDRSIQGNGIYDIVANHLNKHGRPIQVIYNAKPKYSVAGELLGFVGTTTDITESVRAQIAIRNNSELFSAILARLPVIFFRVDENGYLVDIRGQGLKRMGVDDMAWVGRPGYGLFVGMDEMIDSALSGKTVHFKSSGTYEGSPWWFYISMFFDSWSGLGAVGFAVDITDQMESEEKLVELLKDNQILAKRLVEVQEEERRNLSRELHDELGQSITAVKSLATAITAAAGDSYSEIRSLGNSIVDLSGRLYEVVNSLMRRLRPDILDSLGFKETINSCLSNSHLERTGVNCQLQIRGKVENLNEVVQVTVYRIVQECLTNISKYAMASNVKVYIERQQQSEAGRTGPGADTLLIRVSDDGVGMDLDADASSSVAAPKMGLQGIKERVTALGGALRIDTAPGKGVVIEAVIDLAAKPDSAAGARQKGVVEEQAAEAAIHK